MTLCTGALQRLQSLLHRQPKSLRSMRDNQRSQFTPSLVHSSWSPTWQYVRLPFYTLQLALLVHFVANHVGFVAYTIGPSMVPTLSAKGDRVFISRLNKRGKGIMVGDLVDFDHPLLPGMGAIKRVVGMPGDFVVKDPPAVGGKIAIGKGGLIGWVGDEDGNGRKPSDKVMLQVPQGHCWIVGDNMPESRDSRTYGPIPLGLITGKVIAKVWPFSEAKWIENNLQPVAIDF